MICEFSKYTLNLVYEIYMLLCTTVDLPRARRGRVRAGKRGGVLGVEGVARVVPDRLPAMRQPLRAG